MGHHQRRAFSLTALRQSRRDRGAVTAEFAVLLPAIIIVIVLILMVGMIGSAHVRNQDAARQAARMSAAGESQDAARSAATRIAGADASVTLTHEGEWVSVTVTTRPHLPGGWSLPFDLTATAHAWAEDRYGPD